MAAHVRRRRLRGRQGAGSRLRLVAALFAPLMALALAPVVSAQPAPARPALSVAAGLLPSVLPTVCVGGVVLCPGTVVALPTALPVPLPTACIPGAVCTGDVVGTPAPRATATPPSGATPGQRSSLPGAARSAAGPGPSSAPAVPAALPAPPLVGIVPLPQEPAADAGLSPDAFANLLSLSLRDGLGSARYHVWPWLLVIQLVLWTAIAVVAWSRQLSSNAARQGR